MFSQLNHILDHIRSNQVDLQRFAIPIFFNTDIERRKPSFRYQTERLANNIFTQSLRRICLLYTSDAADE